MYPLESMTRWEVIDLYTLAFWAKTSVDLEPRRIGLKSSSYTINNILDLVTAASIQSKEIGSSSNPLDLMTGTEQSVEKEKGFIDWTNLIKSVIEEKDHWEEMDRKRKIAQVIFYRSEVQSFWHKNERSWLSNLHDAFTGPSWHPVLKPENAVCANICSLSEPIDARADWILLCIPDQMANLVHNPFVNCNAHV